MPMMPILPLLRMADHKLLLFDIVNLKGIFMDIDFNKKKLFVLDMDGTFLFGK